MPGKILELRFPLGGVSRTKGFELAGKKETYTSPWAVNVRPIDPLAQRRRGGSRPGIAAYTIGDEPAWPTADLLNEAGTNITTEAGANIEMPVFGSESLNSQSAAALTAYGVASMPETLTATSGTAPTSPSLGCVYRDRLVLVSSSYAIYMSRQSDWADWDYGGDVEDVGRAVVFQLSEAGEIGETVTALVPYKDRYLLCATENELWVVEGDPAAAGSLRCVSRHVGMLNSTSWCLAHDTVYFLSRDGLYSVQADGSGLKPLSSEHLPEELLDIDLTSVTPVMGYSHSEEGVYLFLVGGDYHYFYDLGDGGFWPFALPSALDPTRVFQVGQYMVLWDGTNVWFPDGNLDDAAAIESHLLLGPFRPGSPNEMGMLSALHAALETDSGGAVTWRMVTSNTAEAVCDRSLTAVEAYLAGNTATAEGYVVASGTWNDGRSYMAHPRIRCMWFVLWLQSTDVWAFEHVVAEIQKFGNWRG